MKALFLYEAVGFAIFLLLFVMAFFLINGFTTEIFIIIFSLSMIFAAIVGFIFFQKLILPLNRRANFEMMYEIVNYSKYSIFSGISVLVILKADVLMLSYFHNPQLVGIYGMALFVNEAINVIFDSILRICLPKASALSEKGNEGKIHFLFKQSVKNIYIGIIPIILIIGLLAPPIIHLIYGNKFDGSIPIIYIFLLASLIKPVGGVAGLILSATGKIKLDNRNCWAAALFNLFLNYLFIPKYEILGAAVASLLSFLLLTILHYISLRKHVLVTYPNPNQ